MIHTTHIVVDGTNEFTLLLTLRYRETDCDYRIFEVASCDDPSLVGEHLRCEYDDKSHCDYSASCPGYRSVWQLNGLRFAYRDYEEHAAWFDKNRFVGIGSSIRENNAIEMSEAYHDLSLSCEAGPEERLYVEALNRLQIILDTI